MSVYYQEYLEGTQRTDVDRQDAWSYALGKVFQDNETDGRAKLRQLRELIGIAGSQPIDGDFAISSLRQALIAPDAATNHELIPGGK